MLAPPPDRPPTPVFPRRGRNHSRERGVAGGLAAVVVFPLTLAAGLYVVGLVREVGGETVAAVERIEAPGE